MVIRFYSTKEEYGSFSNFSAHPVELQGRIWPTSEHYFQAQKFAGTPGEDEIRAAPSPMVAARMGRSRKRPLRHDWEQAKDQIMRDVVRAKFEQHAELRELLLSTGDEEIVEAALKDDYWGCGSAGMGRNMLGIILMETREALRKGEAIPLQPLLRDGERKA